MADVFVASIWAAFIDDGDDGDHQLPPGSPPMRKSSIKLANKPAHTGLIRFTAVKFEGPWFTTQLTISAIIGIFSFLVFSYCRTRWPLLFAPRTKLKGSFHSQYVRKCHIGLTTSSVIKVSLHMKLTHTRLSLDGLCQLSGHLSLLFFRLLVWMLLWYGVAPIISPVALDMIVLYIAVKLLQNVFLPLFCLFYVRDNYPYANELEGLIISDLLLDNLQLTRKNLAQYRYRW
jgi:hypothetical protein